MKTTIMYMYRTIHTWWTNNSIIMIEDNYYVLYMYSAISLKIPPKGVLGQLHVYPKVKSHFNKGHLSHLYKIDYHSCCTC